MTAVIQFFEYQRDTTDSWLERIYFQRVLCPAHHVGHAWDRAGQRDTSILDFGFWIADLGLYVLDTKRVLCNDLLNLY